MRGHKQRRQLQCTYQIENGCHEWRLNKMKLEGAAAVWEAEASSAEAGERQGQRQA